MTSEEMRKLFYRHKKLEDRFKSIYSVPFFVRNEKPCFQARNGHYFLVTSAYSKEYDGFIVIEHADSLEEVKLNRFEDGDAFYMDDMTEDEMFEAMVREIESD